MTYLYIVMTYLLAVTTNETHTSIKMELNDLVLLEDIKVLTFIQLIHKNWCWLLHDRMYQVQRTIVVDCNVNSLPVNSRISHCYCLPGCKIDQVTFYGSKRDT